MWAGIIALPCKLNFRAEGGSDFMWVEEYTCRYVSPKCIFLGKRYKNGQLGHGESKDRNIPTIIEALSDDGASGQQIEISNVDLSSGKTWISPSERYAVVHGETGSGSDISVPENDVKRIRL